MFKEFEERYGLKYDLTASTLAGIPNILTVHREEEDEEAVWQAVREVTDEALQRFIAMREKEGARLREDILSRRDMILKAVERVEERSPQTVREHMEKVEARMRDLLSTVTVDEQRLLTEAALFADKIAVAEETVRLRSHITQFRALLEEGGIVGRKIDFLIQEMNRETNTIGSKCTDLAISHIVVDMKSEIEKLREQVQNIE